MVAGTTYTSQRRYARKTGKPKVSKAKGKPRAKRSHKGEAKSLSKALLKKLDNRYVEEDEAETKLSPISNQSDWMELNTYGAGTGTGPVLTNPIVSNAPIAPCTLVGQNSGAWAVCGNVFQFGRTLSTDLLNYNTYFTAFNQEPAFPIGGMSWYNPAGGSANVPLGTNPTRIMDGQYINLRRSTINFSINMAMVNATESRSFTQPCAFRVIHVSAKRDNSPAGVVYSPTNSLFLKEDGTPAGLYDLYDQSPALTSRISKQQAMKYPINKQYFRVLSDFGFTLQNPTISKGFDSEADSNSNSTNITASQTFPIEKQFTITRNWGKQNKTIMVQDTTSTDGLWIPKDENYKDYIIIMSVRGLCSPSSAGGYLNTPDYGKGSGYNVSFFGTTSAKDL